MNPKALRARRQFGARIRLGIYQRVIESRFAPYEMIRTTAARFRLY